MPYSALTQLLANGPTEAAAGAGAIKPSHMWQHGAGRPVLTSRQTAVLDLMAEGHGNAVIARTLRCSEHTVKNTIYDLMSRLQARNRAHAVAHGLRHGLI
ncbi:response regulator transcription factor [Streptacidiphilus anmyonensis]|uniref:response regulator transcription factor n=1 Tax=Streptacidiphilus anmyonensis TaxID=405782 RepID=UPI000A5CD990|nr:LuxR C-terminal-related transcriptional regulator [Streptacidiphilus anmyonensis]